VLTRLARVLFAALLLTAWQAALEHPIEHATHEDSALCDTLDALTACAPGSQPVLAAQVPDYADPLSLVCAPRLANALPFLSQGPPSAPA
jgi:hypothetical protein